MHKAALLIVILVTAAAAAGCGSEDDDNGRRPAPAATTAAAADPCAGGRARPRQPRHADDRHRQPRLPALVRRRHAGLDVGDQRPLHGRGLRERGRLRRRRRARLRRERGRVDRRPVRPVVQARPEELRLRHQPDLDHATSARRPSTSATPTTTSTRRSSRSKGSTLAGATTRRRAQGREAGRPGRHHEPRLHQRRRSSRARSRPSTTRNNDVISALKAKQIDGIVVDLPTAFFVTAVELEDGTIVGPVPGRGRAGAVRDGVREGQPADRLRERGARGAARQTARSTPSSRSGSPTRRARP